MAAEGTPDLTTAEFGSTAYSLLSGLLLATAADLVVLMGLALTGEYGGPLLLLPGLGAFVAPALVYFDADRLSIHTDHEPRIGRLVVLSLLVALLVVGSADDADASVGLVLFLLLTLVGPLFYVDRRRRYVAERVEWDGWIRVGGTLAFGALALFALAWAAILPSWLGVLPWLVAAPYPIAIYWDACHVREREGGWTPAPALHLLGATVGALLPPTLVLHVAYFSFMRR